MGDPLWLTVINTNAQWGIVHLVAMERPLQLAGRLNSLRGQESCSEPRATNNTAADELETEMLLVERFSVVVIRYLKKAPGCESFDYLRVHSEGSVLFTDP